MKVVRSVANRSDSFQCSICPAPSGRLHMLAVVQNEQDLLASENISQRLNDRLTRLLHHADRPGHGLATRDSSAI